MQIMHPFDMARIARGRREYLALRQIEVAKGCGVGREWLVDFEHGKPTVSLGLAVKTLRGLGLEIYVHATEPPDWTKPLTKAAALRKARLDALSPRGRMRKARCEIEPPADYVKLVEERGGPITIFRALKIHHFKLQIW